MKDISYKEYKLLKGSALSGFWHHLGRLGKIGGSQKRDEEHPDEIERQKIIAAGGGAKRKGTSGFTKEEEDILEEADRDRKLDELKKKGYPPRVIKDEKERFDQWYKDNPTTPTSEFVWIDELMT